MFLMVSLKAIHSRRTWVLGSRKETSSAERKVVLRQRRDWAVPSSQQADHHSQQPACGNNNNWNSIIKNCFSLLILGGWWAADLGERKTYSKINFFFVKASFEIHHRNRQGGHCWAVSIKFGSLSQSHSPKSRKPKPPPLTHFDSAGTAYL